jgi:hypothetical protein
MMKETPNSPEQVDVNDPLVQAEKLTKTKPEVKAFLDLWKEIRHIKKGRDSLHFTELLLSKDKNELTDWFEERDVTYQVFKWEILSLTVKNILSVPKTQSVMSRNTLWNPEIIEVPIPITKPDKIHITTIRLLPNGNLAISNGEGLDHYDGFPLALSTKEEIDIISTLRTKLDERNKKMKSLEERIMRRYKEENLKKIKLLWQNDVSPIEFDQLDQQLRQEELNA